MWKGHYYLMRHSVRSSFSSDWDFLTNPAGWHLTPTAMGGATSGRVPILENALRLELRFEGRDDSVLTNGTRITTAWNNTDPSDLCSIQPNALTPSVTNPLIVLPRAVHIRLAVIDRRSADRLAAVLNNAKLLDSDLAYVIPNCAGQDLNNISNQVVKDILRENLRIFYKTVYLRNTTN